MSAPQVIYRSLTFHFPRSVSFPDEKPDVLQVTVMPLGSPSAPGQDLTFVDPLSVQEVTLSGTDNTATFELLPSYWSGLTEPVLYRAQWRTGITGRTFSSDFAMPDTDIAFADLADLGNIIDGENYLTQDDLGVAGRVARLDSQGRVVDAAGHIMAIDTSVSDLDSALADEIAARTAADADNAQAAQDALESEITSTTSALEAYADNAVAATEALISQEHAGRVDSDDALGVRIDGVASDLSDLTDSTSASLAGKADLDGGTVVFSQIPAEALTRVTPAANQVAMLALTTVQTGDLCIRPDGLFALTGENPATLGHWTPLTIVSSVNGARGAVTFDLDDLSARGGQILQSQVAGLETALGTKADAATVSSIGGRVTALETDLTVVHLVNGVIPRELVDSSFAAQSDVDALESAMAGKAAQSALDSLTSTVGTKAAQSALDSLTSTVGTKAAQSALDSLTSTVGTKAAQSALDSLTSTVGTKADSSTVGALTTTVSGKASQSALDSLTSTVAGKAAQSDMTTAQADITSLENTKADLVSGTVPLNQIPILPTSQIVDLELAFDAKADLVGGTVPAEQLGAIPQSAVTNLVTNLAAKADLDPGTGKLLASQLPSLSMNTVTVVASRAAMLSQNSTQVQPGDVTVITAGADRGSYMLTLADPTVFSNWVKLSSSDGAVFTVNGQTGDVTITAASIGARPTATPLALSDTTGLEAALGTKVSTTDLATALTTRTTPADVATILTASATVKSRVARVATDNVVSLSGAQSIDGGLATGGSLVLLTAQITSAQNGLWVVNGSGAWTRTTDFAVGSSFIKGTIVAVSSGDTYANTLWQQMSATGVVDTNTNTWTKIGDIAPPYVPIAGNGINLSGDKKTFSVKNTTGITVTGSGVGIDTTVVVRKAIGAVPSGSATAVITHNLGTTSIMGQIIEVATGNLVLAPITAVSTNTASVEFSTAPSTNQFRYLICG